MSSHRRNLDRPVMLLLDGEWTEEFSCLLCGNTSHGAGFHACDERGAFCDPDLSWAGIWRCDGCGQRYWPRQIKEGAKANDDANQGE